jgi:hypothetical protein
MEKTPNGTKRRMEKTAESDKRPNGTKRRMEKTLNGKNAEWYKMSNGKTPNGTKC